MSDLKTNTTALRAASNSADSSGFNGEFSVGLSKRDKRSSVADRTALWSSQMQVSLLLSGVTITSMPDVVSRLYIRTLRGLKSFSPIHRAGTLCKMLAHGLSWTMLRTSQGGQCRYFCSMTTF